MDPVAAQVRGSSSPWKAKVDLSSSDALRVSGGHTPEDLDDPTPELSSSVKSGQAGKRYIAGGWTASIAPALAAALMMIGLFLYQHRMRAQPTNHHFPNHHLAVVPLINAGQDAEDEYLVEGLTDELSAVLARVPGLRVAARSATLSIIGTKRSARDIGTELGVGSILEGTVRRKGSRLRVNLQLVSSADGLTLWSDTYERPVSDLVALRDEIAKAVVQVLRPHATGALRVDLASSGSNDPEAHALYLKGRFLSRKGTEADLLKSLDFLERSLAKDPRYARAWAGLADTWVWLADQYVPGSEGYRKAKVAASKALELDSTIAEAHAVLVIAHESLWELRAAEREFKRAIALNPNQPDAFLYYSWALTAKGQIDSALVVANRAQLLDPLSPLIMGQRAWFMYVAGDYEQAVHLAQEALEVDPNCYTAFMALGDALLAQENPGEALSVHQLALDRGLDMPAMRSGLGVSQAQLGQLSKARQTIRDLVRESAQSYVMPVFIARVYAALGEADSAFVWLERAYQVKDSSLMMMDALANRYWQPISSDPRFARLRRRIELKRDAA
jgi:TolB-like protein/Tfp pilus assembly protein PilF